MFIREDFSHLLLGNGRYMYIEAQVKAKVIKQI